MKASGSHRMQSFLPPERRWWKDVGRSRLIAGYNAPTCWLQCGHLPMIGYNAATQLWLQCGHESRNPQGLALRPLRLGVDAGLGSNSEALPQPEVWHPELERAGRTIRRRGIPGAGCGGDPRRDHWQRAPCQRTAPQFLQRKVGLALTLHPTQKESARWWASARDAGVMIIRRAVARAAPAPRSIPRRAVSGFGARSAPPRFHAGWRLRPCGCRQ